jgi:hypothetical protein
MKQLKQEQEVITQYLLGGLNEAAQQQVEERLITDRKYKEEVLMIEDELLEDYLAGTLSEIERDMFRQHYLSSPPQQQKLRIAQAVNKYVVDKTKLPPHDRAEKRWFRALLDFFNSRSRLVQFSWAAALALILIAGSWMLFQAWRTRSEQARRQEELARLNGPQSIAVSPDPSVLPVTLASVQLRELGDSKRVAITSETKIVQLRLPVAADKYQSYRAVLAVNGGPEVFKLDGLKVRTMGQGRMLVLQIPARILTANDYLLKVSGLNSDGRSEDVGDYSFRVLSQQ